MKTISALSVIQPLSPADKRWVKVNHQVIDLEQMGYPYAVWLLPFEFTVISAVEYAVDPGHPDVGPEYHVSVSRATEAGNVRCTLADAIWVMAQFGAAAAKEDNHVPNGIARHFWMPVAENLVGYECPCVDEEPKMVEDKGDFVWRGVTR